MESHLQTSDTGAELGKLSCRAIRQMTRSKLNDRHKVIREGRETWVMAGAETGITNHVGQTGNLTHLIKDLAGVSWFNRITTQIVVQVPVRGKKMRKV